ncbi:hypothetical protein [Helicobacter sp. MIT 01-3238]|uniref:hypothetical protein n=1 Tax=Helicobacter sp. MIT 01-3238 TaxID=398627 RepID=UPI000E1EAE2C|nr:hypothetical protein [Helicobacter sp. MIT 01-3238]RDU53989.1 hypothetical protein CQA40_04060 [Helicobacter sp. MIT 01-3238]
MAGKYLDLEIKYLREDLDSIRKRITLLRVDTRVLWNAIERIQDLVGIERKVYLIEDVIEILKNDGDFGKSLVEDYEKILKEIEKYYKEQNKLH